MLKSSFFSILFLWLIWLVFYFDNHYNLNLIQFGLKPRTIEGLLGIFTMPLLHGDFQHIFSNSVPLLVLGTLLFSFYKEVALKVFFLIYFVSGVLLWCFANLGERYMPVHIGASGLVYGLYGFLFLSGLIKKDKSLFAVTLIVTLLYGTVVWGIFPTEFQRAIFYSEKTNVSWQGHLAGFSLGLLLAYRFRKRGVKEPVYSWEINKEEDLDESNPYWMVNENGEPLYENAAKEEDEHELLKNTSDNPYTVYYTFIPKKDEQNNKVD